MEIFALPKGLNNSLRNFHISSLHIFCKTICLTSFCGMPLVATDSTTTWKQSGLHTDRGRNQEIKRKSI